jgi:hypothetical protein
VIDALSGPVREALDELVERLGRPVALRGVKDYPVGQFEIAAADASLEPGHGL